MSTYYVLATWGEKISTTVAKQNEDVDASIDKFLSKWNNFVIGPDTELSLSRDSEGVTRSKIAILTLYDEDHCLIVQLPHLDSVPTSLCNFLQLADYTFVGFNIARSVERLEKEYGFGCKNYDDLKTMAAKYEADQPYVAFWGSAKMNQGLPGFSGPPVKPKSAVFDGWGGRYLNENQVTRSPALLSTAILIVKLGNFFGCL